MNKSSKAVLFKSLIVAAILLFVSPAMELLAQPTNYCRPFCNPAGGYTYCYCYNYFAFFSHVKMTKVSTGEVVLERQSGQDNCYIFVQDRFAKMEPGQDYCLYLRRYNYSYYNYTRVYIDWNIDGDFFDRNLYMQPTVNERYWVVRSYGYSTWFTTNCVRITVPEDVEMNIAEGRTRMRLITNYYYDYGPCCMGYCYSTVNYGYGEVEDYILKFEGGVKDTYPGEGDILFAGEVYDGTTRQKNGVDEYFQKPTAIFNSNQPSGTQIEFRIWGPAPATTVVYEALDPDNGSNQVEVGGKCINAEYTMEAARGTCADGTEGDFKADRGGTYRVYAKQIGKPSELVQVFFVSWDDDLAISGIVSPRTNVAPKYFKYLRGQTIRITGLFQNVGLNDVTSFDAFALIWNSDNDLVYRDSIRWEGTLAKGDKVELDFRNVRFNDVGGYTLEICCDLLSAVDQDSYNDCVARSDEEAYSFEVSHEIQVQADDILLPAQDEILLGNRPIIPQGQFKNVGIGDASDVPARMIVKKLPDGDIVYESNIIIQDIQAGKYNTRVANFDQMTIRQSGEYEACIIITAEEDIVREDDTLCITFTVEGGLEGVYTVGHKYSGQSKNYETIEDAMDALYYRGMAASVVMELTDNEYNVIGRDNLTPAWDFTSRIIGLGMDADNEKPMTLTWRAHRTRAMTSGGVQINLSSGNGQGVKFGQSLVPSNEYAIVNKFPNSTNANTPGYIIFDGGMQKALQFNLFSASNAHGAAIYLGRGSHHITINNCIIENSTPRIACNTRLPLVTYDPTNGFIFQPDSTLGATNESFSAGIVTRSTLLRIEESDFMRLDTVKNSDNVISNNDISGFGYGLVSLGLGTLYLENEAYYGRYYNTGNIYSGNTIHDVCRAGIVLGYEENSEISNNRIYDIGNGSPNASGIMVGGQSRDGFVGYNCVDLKIDGNEISDISADNMVHGIRVEQVRNSFQNPAGGEFHFPNVPENLVICNNVIWGLTPTDADAIVAGIHVYTERTWNPIDQWDQIVTPEKDGYLTRNDKIANNTIVISDDGGMVNTGPIAGICLQQSQNAVICNNAIAILDNSIDNSNMIASAIFFQGIKPDKGGYTADRNAFWLGNSGGSIYRFVEMDDENQIIDQGQRNEFENLNQWQLWTGADGNSVYGDFTQDLVYQGSEPQKLRMNCVPEPPLGSILDNRGDRLDFVTGDIDDNDRGAAGQRYDIGAYEFIGRMYVSDVEMISMPTPGAYKSGSGMFNDAEYIMTTEPVEIHARIRNNGSLQQSGVNVKVEIFLELPNGLYDNVPVLEETVQADIPTTESADIYFNLSDNIDPDFKPQTYAMLGSTYTVPDQFSTMRANVTPKHNIVISVESDQNNANNIISKEVRFYIKKSPLRLLISCENSFADLYYSGPPTVDQIAGRLNADSLVAGLKMLGWYTDLDEARYDIDLFDRNGWEPKSVNYTMYRSMFWSDGDDKALTRYEKMDVRDFLDIGNDVEKKNLMIGSQEMVRMHGQNDPNYDPDWINDVMRGEYYAPGNPLGADISNDGNQVKGVVIGRDLVENIAMTGYADDVPPFCGLMRLIPDGEGLAQVAYDYVNHDAAPDLATMGVATTTLTKNIVNLGVDWRHWDNMERLLRAILDYVENNGGTIVPIELAEFNADPIGKRVDISWATSSELNSAMFEVEKADMSEAGRSEFAKIANVEAVGKSAVRQDYGPVNDYNVEYGNSYVYRLKMIDKDGNYKFSDEKVVTMDAGGILKLGEARPNPANEVVRFDLLLKPDVTPQVMIYDVNGKLVDATADLSDGKIEINLHKLSSGTYNLMLKSGDAVLTRTFRVIK